MDYNDPIYFCRKSGPKQTILIFLSTITFNKLVFSGQKNDEKGVKSFIFAFKFCLSLLTEVFKNLGINIFKHHIIVVLIVNKKGIFSQKVARENK